MQSLRYAVASPIVCPRSRIVWPFIACEIGACPAKQEYCINNKGYECYGVSKALLESMYFPAIGFYDSPQTLRLETDNFSSELLCVVSILYTACRRPSVICFFMVWCRDHTAKINIWTAIQRPDIFRYGNQRLPGINDHAMKILVDVYNGQKPSINGDFSECWCFYVWVSNMN